MGSAKRGVEYLLARSGIAWALRRKYRGRTLILAYHNIVPDGSAALGDRSLHLPQRTYGRQLDVLQRTHDVVPLEAALETPLHSLRPRAVITFDDATRGALTAGLEELVARGLTATYFVAPSFVPGHSFWWDAIGELTEVTRTYALEELAGSDVEIRAWARSGGPGMRAVPEHQLCGSEAELLRAEAHGMTLGSHTWSHRNLAVVSGADLVQELERPLAWLRERFRAVLPWLAFPCGLFSPEAIATARELGYQGALRVEGGWVPQGGDLDQVSLSLPRLNIPSGMSVDGFALRTSGVSGYR